MVPHVSSGVLLCLLLTVSAFDIPDLESISDFFSHLYKSNTDSQRQRRSVDEIERIKRQSTDIGDESQLPYEIRSSRRYYRSQNELLSSIDDIRLNMDGYQEEPLVGHRTISTSTIAKITFAINFALFSVKVVAAAMSGSMAIVSSVLDSAVDLVSGLLMWWSNRAIKYADHYLYPRGRRKLEPLAIVILAVIMSLASVQVIQSSVERILSYVSYDFSCDVRQHASNSTNSSVICGTPDELKDTLGNCFDGESGPTVGLSTILICSVTIVTKLVMYLVCRKTTNPTVQALAQDHRNDVLSNTSALAFGLIGYHLWKYCDPVGAILISFYIIINWFITAYDQTKLLTGYTASPDVINKLTWVIFNHDSRILYLDDLTAFHFGNNYLVEVDIVLPEEMAIREAHDIGETLGIKLERMPDIERVFVHVDYECGYKHHLTRL